MPNECEDGHSNCKPQGNPITQFGDFLSRSGTAATSCSRMGPQVNPGVYDQGSFTRYSLVRTLEDGFGNSSNLGHAIDFEVNPDLPDLEVSRQSATAEGRCDAINLVAIAARTIGTARDCCWSRSQSSAQPPRGARSSH